MQAWVYPGNLGDKRVVKTFSACTLYLATHAFVGGLMQTSLRPKDGHPPEDVILGMPVPEEDSGDAWDTGKRIARAVGNTTENVPLDLLLAWLAVFLGNKDSADSQRKLIIGYTACRVGHSVSYVAKLQPFRTLFYIGSKACVGVLAAKAFANFVSNE